ncbi:biliverdin-producing heme oxygenase [Nostoc sp.]|uniref:biliverdin-producing heme oxygenase n=1 Tax=Nostoc sp. TaxID=1180 RepID=UPI002FF4DC27
MMHFPELHRQKNFEKDLAFYYDENWRSQIERFFAWPLHYISVFLHLLQMPI